MVEARLNLKGNLIWQKGGFQRDLQYTVVDISEPLHICQNPLNVAEFWIKVELRRHIRPYVEQIFFPTSLMVLVSWASFLIPWNSFPGRVGLLVGLLLCLINILLNTLSNSPNIVGVNALATWVIICIVMVTVAIIEYSGLLCYIQFKNKVHPKNNVVRSRRNKITKYHICIRCLDDKHNCEKPATNDQNVLGFQKNKFDSCAMLLTPALFLVILVVYLAIFYECQDINPEVEQKKMLRIQRECDLMNIILQN